MSTPRAVVVNLHELEEGTHVHGEGWASFERRLTPKGASLGVNLCRVPPRRSGCPCHAHQLEAEVFIVQSGRGVLRYGDELRALAPGDCVYCPAGTGIGHQLANPFDEDFVYLAIGPRDPNEVCTYPDTGKVMVRSLGQHGRLAAAPNYEGEPEPPKIFALADELASKQSTAEKGLTVEPAGGTSEPPA